MLLIIITNKFIGGVLSGIAFPITFFSFLKQFIFLTQLNKIYQLPFKNSNFSTKVLKYKRSQTVKKNEIDIINKILFYRKLANVFFIPFLYILFSMVYNWLV